MVFAIKSRQIEGMTKGGDEGKSFIFFFRSFIYSLPTPQDCVSPVVHLLEKWNSPFAIIQSMQELARACKFRKT